MQEGKKDYRAHLSVMLPKGTIREFRLECAHRGIGPSKGAAEAIDAWISPTIRVFVQQHGAGNGDGRPEEKEARFKLGRPALAKVRE